MRYCSLLKNMRVCVKAIMYLRTHYIIFTQCARRWNKIGTKCIFLVWFVANHIKLKATKWQKGINMYTTHNMQLWWRKGRKSLYRTNKKSEVTHTHLSFMWAYYILENILFDSSRKQMRTHPTSNHNLPFFSFSSFQKIISLYLKWIFFLVFYAIFPSLVKKIQ